MTVRLDLTHSRVDAAPGDVVSLPIRLTNTADTAALCRVRIVGLDDDTDAVGSGVPNGSPPAEVIVPAGATIEVLSPVAVPWVLGIGDHTAAIEITSDRPGDRAVLAPFVISIGSVARVELTPLPATMRGRRHAKFKLDVVNNEPVPVDLVISAEAPEIEVQFRMPAMRLQPGERALTAAKVKGPRHWSGESTQHNLVITAAGRASSTSTTAAYIQRPLFAHRARMAVAALTVVALWLGAIGGVALWWSNRADEEVAGEGGMEIVGRDTDGDGIDDLFTYTDADGNVITGIDTDGDGVADQFTDAAGNPVGDPTAGGGTGGSGGSGSAGDSGGSGDGAGDGSGDEGPTGPTSALVRGTVKADGDPSNITITLAPIALGTAPEPATGIQGFVGPKPPEAAKIWSARAVPPGTATLNPVRQTEPLAPQQTTPQADGVWQFPNVGLRRSYEIVFAKPGFDTQSFVVTPPDDGSALDLDVEMVAANGMIGGTVRGPSGALGGAEIVVTDGILTFTTTSATVGDVGTWSIEQISTPGVYTVSATLRGYGTEVRQVRLEAGDAFPNADLTMQLGMGSISGRVVGPDGQPVGGVSITATNGDESRTTSSLTEGDVGSYNIPQLSVGGTFTLSVTAPGYLPESRRIPVGGPVGGVNFGLTKTTLTMTGTIISSGNGLGIANAGLTLTTGDLTFRAATAGGANRGTFAIADLPPGSYTVTVDHYQHVSATQLVVLTAGVTPPPLDLTLERSSGLPALGTGSLVVEVVDPSAKTAEARQIKNATVRLIRTQTGQELPPTTQEAFNFRIENIPIGTYTLLVTAPRYNAAAPRQVSIGLSQERVEVQMLRLGQASGYVVDSLTNAKLTNYFVNIYRQPENPGDAPIYVLQGDSVTGLWQTPADSLVPGTYRIDIPDSSSPPGYLVRNDQVIDPAVVGLGAERNMRFVLPADAVDPVTVGSIEADPYPTITGRVYKPVMPPDTVAIEPIDSADLGVTMSCPGGNPVPAALLDDAGVQGATPPTYDSWVITKQQIDAANLEGDCTLAIRGGAGFQDNTVPLAGVQASDGASSSDRRVHSVLGPPAPSIGGTVFWLNGSLRVPITNATVSATRATAYSVVENADPNVAPAPIPTPGSTTSGAGGVWDLDGQVTGVAPYVFAAPNFGDGRIDVRVDPTGAATATAGPGAALAATPADGRFHVEMSAPTPRTLTGVITVQTIGTANFGLPTACGGAPPSAGICITATSPTGTVITEATAGPTTIVRLPRIGNTLPFEIRGAQPGTWQVSVSEPTNHDEFGNTIPVDMTVDPGSTPVPGFNMSLVENATLELTLADGNATPITTAPTIQLNGVTYPSTFVPATTTPVKPAHFVVTNIPVDALNPLALPGRAYTMRLTLTGYDTTLTQAVPINVRAGQTLPLSLTLPKFGTLAGVVEGDDGTSIEELDIENEGTFTVTRVDVNGNPVTPAGYIAPVFTIVGGRYEVSGQAGYYRIDVAHPQFGPDPTPPTDNFVPPLASPEPSPQASVFQIVNDDANTPASYVLSIIPGTLSMSVVQSLSDPIPLYVPGASYTLFDAGTSTVVSSGLVDDGVIDGQLVVPNLRPGPYRLELRQYATAGVPASGEIAFPVITAITISRATPSTPPGGPSTPTVTTVRAPLPPLQPTVTGLILGRNSDNRAVGLPATAGTYSITGTFTEPSIEINGSTTVPNPSQGNSVAVIDPAAVAAAGTTGMVPYTFSNVPSGAHELTIATTPAAAMTGYTLDGSPTRSFAADVGVVAGPNFTYTVSDVQLRIQFPTGTYPDITTMRLTSPTGQAVYGTGAPTTIATFDDETDELIFEGVAPELGNFKLDFDDALHAAVSQVNVLVAPDLDGNATFVSTFDLGSTPAGDMGRLRGSVAQRNTATDSTGLQAGASITVTRTSGLGACAAPTPCSVTVVPGMTEYQIDLAPGSYSVVTAQTDFQSQTVNVTVSAGQIRLQDLSISKYATFTFTITNDPLPTNTTMVLSDGTPAVYTSTTAPAAGGGTAYTFKVPAQTPAGLQKFYTGTAAAPGYQRRNLPNDLDSYAPEIGSTTTVTPFALTARTFTVTVNAAPSGPAPAGTEVVARFDGLAFPDVVAPFTFSSAAIPTLPLGGVGTAVADAPGYRANSATIPESGSPSPIAISPVVTVSGTITKPAGTATLPAGTKVTATAPGMTPIEANVTVDPLPGGTGNGSYTLTGLDVGLDLAGVPESKTWTIVYDVAGVGRFTTTVNVTPTSASSVPLSFTPEPQSVNVIFTVTGAANGSVDVTFSGETKPVTPSTAGTPVTFAAFENETALGYTVDGPGYLTVTPGTVVFAANRANTPVAVPITVRPSITGTVSSGPPSNSNVNNATVRVCPATATAICAAGPTAPDDTTNNSGVFVIPELLPPGPYRLWAVGPGGGTPPDGFASLDVAANRSYTLSPTTIVLD